MFSDPRSWLLALVSVWAEAAVAIGVYTVLAAFASLLIPSFHATVVYVTPT